MHQGLPFAEAWTLLALHQLAALAVAIVMVGAIAKVHWTNGLFLNWSLTPGKGHGDEANLGFLAMAVACLLAGGGGWPSTPGWLASRAEAAAHDPEGHPGQGEPGPMADPAVFRGLPEEGENVMDILPRQPLTVADVRELRTSGPWPSKSGGGLRVPIALSEPETRRFFDYDAAELERIGVDIRGVRVFFVSRAPAGGLAGNQFHRLRTEIGFVIQGSVRWEFEDLYGGRRAVHASPACALYIPPFVLHRAMFEEPETTLVTLTNTVYVRDDPRTHDTYSAEAFQTLAERFRAYVGPR